MRLSLEQETPEVYGHTTYDPLLGMCPDIVHRRNYHRMGLRGEGNEHGV